MVPDVNVESFHGPSGDRSVNVILTKIRPTMAGTFHSTFSPMNPLRGVTLESDGAVRPDMAGVEDAIIVAGGIGSRMLPASSMVPKELLPLIDIPAITHLALEAVHAGAKRIHIISSPSKDFSKSVQDNSKLSEIRPDIAEEILSPFSNTEIFIHEQKVAKGLGDAINCALDSIDGPFIVLLGDNILLDNFSMPTTYKPSSASKKLVETYQETHLPCVGLIPVENPENYGVVSMDGNLIKSIVEKPPRESAPSNLVLCGRYLFTEDTSELLDKYSYEEFGELQSIAIQKHWMENQGLVGIHLEEFNWYDSGKPLTWLKGQIDYALGREDYKDELKNWLQERLQR